jgi:diguanylate cyclase (GGDEF)-like protein/PAS domain S-box-containing protein
MSERTPWVQKARYPDLFFRLLDPALLVDPKTQQILDANTSAEHALGASKEDLLHSNLSDWIETSESEDFGKQLRIALRRYHARDTEFHLATAKNGSIFRLYRCALCQLQTADGELIVQIVARDITEERLAQEQNRTYMEELKLLNQKLEALSTTDEMTQLANFRFFKERLAEEHSRAIRFSHSYSILFFDLDHFKQYNDRNGHPAGDRLLRQFADLLKRQARETDLVARYGGEEFVILATETPHAGCLTFAERVRAAVAATPFENAKGQPMGFISVSVGVASYPDNAKTAEDVVKAADDAVYASKKAGRNRVTSAP